MPKIDVTKFIEQSGIRKARFGGYETLDVRQAMQALCTEYEQRLSRARRQVAAAMGAGEAPESLAPEICAAPEEAGGAAAAPAEETAAEPGQGQTAPARDTETPQD